MDDRDRGDRRVGKSQRDPLAMMIALQQTRHARDRPRDVVVLQGPQEFFGGGFLFGAKTRIDFGHVDGAARQEMPLPEQI